MSFMFKSINIFQLFSFQKGRILFILPIIFIFLQKQICISETIVNSNITENAVWTAENSPYYVLRDITVTENAMLTIHPGTIIKFAKARNLFVKGILSAIGTETEKIYFISDNEKKAKSQWGAIHFDYSAKNSNSIISNALFEGGGYNNLAPIVLDARANVDLSNTEMKNNLYCGIEIKAIPYSKNIYLKKFDLPYLALKQIEIEEGAVLEVEPGAVIKFARNTDLLIKGDLIADASWEKQIIFTSIKDDKADGIDSDCNGLSIGEKFDWGGIAIENSGNSFFRYVQIKYGGGSANSQNSLLFLDNSSARIEHCRFEESGRYGMSLQNNAAPDLGKGDKQSAGMNNFFGFSKNYFAILNKSTQNISAKNNCWGTNSPSEIDEMIYDYYDKSRYGKVDYADFLEDCFSLPSIPIPLFPEDHSGYLETAIDFIWEEASSAAEYEFSISKDPFFKNTLLDTSGLKNNMLSIENLEYNTKYFWQLRAVNRLGMSDWSEIFSFSTKDNAKPEKVVLISPENNSEEIASIVDFLWQSSANTEKSHLQISKNFSFSDIIFEKVEMTSNSLKKLLLSPEEKYFWRVRAENMNGLSDWSEVFSFSTAQCKDYPVPASWEFEKYTGSNSIILLTKDTERLFGDFELRKNDAIGVFYNQDSLLRCGGYALLDDKENIAIPVWGNNSMTGSGKDGFDDLENLKFKIWNSCCGVELICAVEMLVGPDYFLPDTISIIKKFNPLASTVINFNRNEWKMVSSPVSPYDAYFKSIVKNKNLTIKENGETVFSPEKNIFISNYWNAQNCYEIFSPKRDSIELKGNFLQAGQNPIYIQARRTQIIPYYLSFPQSVESALAPILQDVLLVKDSEGRCFAPDYMHNSLGAFKPNQAYKIILKNDAVFTYNEKGSQDFSMMEQSGPKHFRHITNRFTGSNAVFLIESNEFEDGDEIAALNENNQILGCALVENSVCLLTIFADNEMTPLEKEGANENESIHFLHWKKKENAEQELNIVELKNLITNQYESILLKYKKDAFYSLFLSPQPSSSKEESKSGEIKFFFDRQSKLFHLDFANSNSKIEMVQLCDILGNELLRKEFSSEQSFVYQIDLNAVQSGIYFIRIKTNQATLVKKIAVY